MSKLFKIFQILFHITVMVIFIVPILSTLIIIPFGLYRLLIVILARIFRPDLISMVRCRDAIFANDKLSTRPNSTIVIMLRLEGDIDLETVRKIAVPKMFGDQKYAVLTQYFVNWCGFVFKKWEKDFDVKDHSREWKKSAVKVNGGLDNNMAVVTPDDIYEIRRKLLVEPFQPEKSAWEAVLVRNYQESEFKPKGSILFTKFHHGILDGYSIVKLFMVTLSNITDLSKALPVPHPISRPLSPIQNVAIFSKLFAEFIPTAKDQNPEMDPANIFHPANLPVNKTEFTQRHPMSTTIFLKTVKNAAKQSQTSFTTVIVAGLTGGVRNYLILKGKQVPKTIDVTMPLPWPGHDDNKIQNHFTYAVIKIPTGLPHHLNRVANLQDQFLRLKQSSVPAYNYVMVFLAGMLPNPVMTRVLKDSTTSILMSSIPGPNCPVEIFDRELLLPPQFEGGYGKGPVGMGVSMLSYNEELGICINPEVGIVPTKDDAEELLKSIVNEIQLIHDSTVV